MPSLFICARITVDVYHDRPTTVDWHQPVRVPDQDVYCVEHEFAGGAYEGRQGTSGCPTAAPRYGSNCIGRRYRAFISCSWADKAWADWLHRALTAYRTWLFL